MKILMLLGFFLSTTAWCFERSPLESIPDQGKAAIHTSRVPSSEPTKVKTDEVKTKNDRPMDNSKDQ